MKPARRVTRARPRPPVWIILVVVGLAAVAAASVRLYGVVSAKNAVKAPADQSPPTIPSTPVAPGTPTQKSETVDPPPGTQGSGSLASAMGVLGKIVLVFAALAALVALVLFVRSVVEARKRGSKRAEAIEREIDSARVVADALVAHELRFYNPADYEFVEAKAAKRRADQAIAAITSKPELSHLQGELEKLGEVRVDAARGIEHFESAREEQRRLIHGTAMKKLASLSEAAQMLGFEADQEYQFVKHRLEELARRFRPQ